MAIVSTIPEKCRRCYTCVRECPAKAIKVEGGQATVVEERCIACGNCVKVCAQQAKHIQDGIATVRAMLRGDQPVIACLAPSFPAAFDRMSPGRLISATRALGFSEVWEVAFGAEMVSREYARRFETARRRGEPTIATPCPAIVAYIEKYLPALQGALAPIVSPMIATGRAIRREKGEAVRVVFIGPCIAKKNELRDKAVAGAVDAALTFRELDGMITEAGLDPAQLSESECDGPHSAIAGSFAIPGGLLKTSGLSTDILENDIVVTEGKDRVLDVLREAAEGRSQARFFDLLFCEGCISGPRMLNELSTVARKEILARYVRNRAAHIAPAEVTASLGRFRGLDLSRGFTPQNLRLPSPPEEEILRTLQSLRKFAPEDQLNCGACGYPTCREKAIAVCQGLAEPEMCLPYLVEELEDTCSRLEKSHVELACAQQRLVQTERLASMGQLSAGVAHEINNPLGTILLYSHMLLKQFASEDARRTDLEMIASEANRCKVIVRGLLDFARQSRVSREPVRLEPLMREVHTIVSSRAAQAGVHVEAEADRTLPMLMLDRAQIKQMLVNLVENGIDATPSGGRVRIEARPARAGEAVDISIRDTGCGIPPEHLQRLFTPFFTTKEMGKGTGLGLAIVYGIVKMHSGDVTVESEVGKGTTFRVTLPVRKAETA